MGSRETKNSDQNDGWRRLEKERTGRTELGVGSGGVGVGGRCGVGGVDRPHILSTLYIVVTETHLGSHLSSDLPSVPVIDRDRFGSACQSAAAREDFFIISTIITPRLLALSCIITASVICTVVPCRSNLPLQPFASTYVACHAGQLLTHWLFGFFFFLALISLPPPPPFFCCFVARRCF